MQIVALAEFELRSAICKVGHERSRVGGYTVTMQIQYSHLSGRWRRLSFPFTVMPFNMALAPEIFPFNVRLLAVISLSVALAPDMVPFRVRLFAVISFKTASLPVILPFKVRLLAVISFSVRPRPGNVALQRKVIGSNVVQDGVNT